MKVVVVLSPGSNWPANQLVIGKDFEENWNFSNPILVELILIIEGSRIFFIFS